MPETAPVLVFDPSSLAERFAAVRHANPKLRARDAAASLGVSEAELVALCCGDGALRLQPRWETLMGALPSLGRVMALTRNEHAVHERTGRYEPARLHGSTALVLGPEIDLRLFLAGWKYAFAVSEAGRQSLQMFDRAGTAVHKVYLLPESDRRAYDRLVAALRSPDQSPGQYVSTLVAAVSPVGSEVDVNALRAAWDSLRDTHDFSPMLRRFAVTRRQALTLAGRSRANRVGSGAFRAALEAAARSGQSIMVFVGNPGAIQIHTGPVERLVATGDWFNVLDPDFNLHLREMAIAEAWIVRKPTADGFVTSLELFAADGLLIAQLFGRRKPGEPEAVGWRCLIGAVEREQTL